MGFALVTAALTFPLAFRLGAVTYNPENGDGQFSTWNTAWVSHALLTTPTRVFDANIFYPDTGTLAYSEANLGSGLLALPVYWLTASPYAAHGFVVLLSFLASAVGMYFLARHLTGDRVAACAAGVIFGYCPHVFAHLLHIQLLWTAGLPWSVLALHRLADRPSAKRGALLGLAMAAQLYLCAYYAVFLLLTIAYLVAVLALGRQLWRETSFWKALAIGAAVSLLAASPLLQAYVTFQRETGFARSLEASAGFSADWRAYFASAAYGHAWLLPWLGRWNEVLFPGVAAVALAGIALTPRLIGADRTRESRAVYLTLGMLAFWASMGPTGHLYAWLYQVFPPLNLMRAPSRFGVVVMLAVSVLAALGLAHLRHTRRLPSALAFALLVFIVGEHVVPLDFRRVPPTAPGYRVLADLPFGPLLELPVYSERAQFIRSRYMLASTTHWRPLVNAYSDYIPVRFQQELPALGDFPNRESLALLTSRGVRYAMVHLDEYHEHRAALEERLREFAPFLALRYGDAATRLYEIIGPAQASTAPVLPAPDDDVIE